MTSAFENLVFLQVPDLDAVRRWRLDQEAERPPGQRLNAAQIEHFVAHYQRLTEWMLEEVPRRAHVVVALAEDHRVMRVTVRDT